MYVDSGNSGLGGPLIPIPGTRYALPAAGSMGQNRVTRKDVGIPSIGGSSPYAPMGGKAGLRRLQAQAVETGPWTMFGGQQALPYVGGTPVLNIPDSIPGSPQTDYHAVCSEHALALEEECWERERHRVEPRDRAQYARLGGASGIREAKERLRAECKSTAMTAACGPQVLPLPYDPIAPPADEDGSIPPGAVGAAVLAALGRRGARSVQPSAEPCTERQLARGCQPTQLMVRSGTQGRVLSTGTGCECPPQRPEDQAPHYDLARTGGGTIVLSARRGSPPSAMAQPPPPQAEPSAPTSRLRITGGVTTGTKASLPMPLPPPPIMPLPAAPEPKAAPPAIPTWAYWVLGATTVYLLATRRG